MRASTIRVGRTAALMAAALAIAATCAVPAEAVSPPVPVRYLASTVGGAPSTAALRRETGSLLVTGVRGIGPRLAMITVSAPSVETGAERR